VNDIEIPRSTTPSNFHHENFPVSPGDSIHLYVSYPF
jgi:hypothetical protein